MKTYRIVLVLILLTGYFAAGQENHCITCHQELDASLALPVSEMKDGVHFLSGILCNDCHGGDPTTDDPELSMDPAKGFVGTPQFKDIAILCAGCHSDAVYMRKFNPNVSTEQYSRYQTSQHGILQAQGDIKVATCTSCHGVHNIKKVSDPTATVYPVNLADQCGKCHADKEYMQEYGIDTQQLEHYKNSVHAKMLYDQGDIGAPTCNDCHGNHGATPPGITSIAYVCGNCHMIQQEYFTASPHKTGFDEMGFSECGECHGNHDIQQTNDEMLGVDEPALCINCHDSDSDGYAVAMKLRTDIDSLKAVIGIAEKMIFDAQKAGVEVVDEEMNLAKAQESLVHYRTMIHTFSKEKVNETFKAGLESSDNAYKIGQQALKELSNRRILLIIMVLLTLLVATLLIFYIKQKENHIH